MTSTRILAIGDVHVKTKNINSIYKLTDYICSNIDKYNPDFVVLLGDILDYHEKVYTQCLNTSLDLIKRIADKVHVYILVGNHDYISNTQFLSTNHWMNALKSWTNVTIVDNVVEKNGFVFCPYVFPGRLTEALGDTVVSKVLFCHQEFRGCDMGSVVSECGDDASSIRTPLIISGHIHKPQRVGENVYYVGSPLQNAFDEEKDSKRICLIEFDDCGSEYKITDIPVNIDLKKTVYVSVDEKESVRETLNVITSDPGTTYRVVVECSTPGSAASFRKSADFKSLSLKSKVVFRPRPDSSVDIDKNTSVLTQKTFDEVVIEKLKECGGISEKCIFMYKTLVLREK